MSRKKLNSEDHILLCEEKNGNNPVQPKCFKIIKPLEEEGSTCVIYEAKSPGNNGRVGILKEFYPRNFSSMLERDNNGQLTPACGYEDSFNGLMNNFIETHYVLQHAKNKPANRAFNNFFPIFEVLRGCCKDENGNDTCTGTAYIWEEQKKLTFEKYCSHVHNDSGRDAIRDLKTILEAVNAMTEGIEVLHIEGLIHQDINPANIAFRYNEEENIYPSTSCLFDMGTICRSDAAGRVGTQGFMAPELLSNKCSFKSDIYSLGACLFWAVTGKTYESSINNFLCIPAAIKEAALMRSAAEKLPAGAAQKLIEELAAALRSCLCRAPSERKYCKELKNHLQNAISYIERNAPGNEGWNTPLCDPVYWCEDMYDEAPQILAWNYRELHAHVLSGRLEKTVLIIRDVFSLMIRIPVTILFNGILDLCANAQKFKTLSAREPKFKRLYEKSFVQLEKISGWWECVCIAASISEDIFDEDNPEFEAYRITLRYLSDLRDIFRDDMVYWCIENTEDGMLAAKSDSGISDCLIMLKNACAKSLPYYRNIRLIDTSGKFLCGWDTGIPETDINIKCLYLNPDNPDIDMKSFLEGKKTQAEGNPLGCIACYDGYKDNQAFMRIPRTNESYVNKKLSGYLKKREKEFSSECSGIKNKRISADDLSSSDVADWLSRNMQGTDVDSVVAKLHAEDQESAPPLLYAINQKEGYSSGTKDIKLAKQEARLSAAKQVTGLNALYQWLMAAVNREEKGLLLMTAQRGYGKSTFSRCIDQCDYSYTAILDDMFFYDWKCFNDKTAVRAYHCGPDSAFNKDEFIESVQKAYLADLPQDIISDALEEKWSNLKNSSEVMRRHNFAAALNYMLDFYRENTSYRKLLLVIDGIDETADFNELSSFIPKEGALNENVYILFISRTQEEIQNHTALSHFINDAQFTARFEYGRDYAQAKAKACEADVDYSYLNNYEETAAEYVRDILRLKEGKYNETNVKDVLEFFEYRFSDLAAYKDFCAKNPVFLDCFKEGTDLFSIFFEHIEAIGTKVYSNGVNVLLKTLAWAGEALTLSEFEYLSGEDHITGDIFIILKDIQPFITVTRSERGNLYQFSHASWKEAVLKKFGNGHREFRLRCEELLDQMHEYFNAENISTILDRNHQGQYWVLRHILEIYIKDWPYMQNSWRGETVQIEKIEDLMQLLFSDKKVTEAYAESYRGNDIGALAMALNIMMEGYLSAVKYFNHFYPLDFLEFDYTRKQIGNFSAISACFDNFINSALEERFNLLQRQVYKSKSNMEQQEFWDKEYTLSKLNMYYRAALITGKAGELWGSREYEKLQTEKLFEYSGIFQNYQDQSKYWQIMILCRQKISDFGYRAADIFSKFLELNKIENLFQKQTDLNLNEKYLLVNMYLKISGRIDWTGIGVEDDWYNEKLQWESTGRSIAECCERAYNILLSFPEEERDVLFLKTKYEAEVRMRYYAESPEEKKNYSEKMLETLQLLIRYGPQNDYSKELINCNFALADDNFKLGNHTEALSYAEITADMCIHYEGRAYSDWEFDKITNLKDIYKINGRAADYRKLIAKEFFREMNVTDLVYKKSFDNLQRYWQTAFTIIDNECNGNLPDGTSSRISPSLISAALYSFNGLTTDNDESVQERILSVEEVDILSYLNNSYIKDPWLSNMCDSKKSDYQKKLTDELIYLIHFYIRVKCRLKLPRKIFDIVITPEVCAEVLWTLNLMPDIMSEVPCDVIEWFINNSADKNSLKNRGRKIEPLNPIKNETYIFMFYLFFTYVNDLDEYCCRDKYLKSLRKSLNKRAFKKAFEEFSSKMQALFTM